MKTLLSTLILFICFSLSSLEAQYKKKDQVNLFGLSAIGGFSATQIDGDFTKGYKKSGIYGGIAGLVRFSHQVRMEIGLIYVEKGSKWGDENNGFQTSSDATLRLNMIEIPITARYFPKGNGAGFYYEAGFSYSRLLERRFEEDFITERSQAIYAGMNDAFKKGEFGIVAGIGIRTNLPVSIGLRFTAAVSKIMDLNLPPVSGSNIFQDRNIGILRNYGFALLTSYEF